jgi:AcrR family transcriptional regulator
VGRPRKFTEKVAVSAAADVFASRGFAGATLDDLAAATGLGRQSLYNAFGDKRALFLRALGDNAAEAIDAVTEAFSSPGVTPMERIRAQVLKLAIACSSPDYQTPLLIKAAVELGGRDPDVALASKGTIDRLAAAYRQCLVEAQRSGEVAADADADELAVFCVAVTQGMEVLGRAGASRATLTAVGLQALHAIPQAGPAPRLADI